MDEGKARLFVAINFPFSGTGKASEDTKWWLQYSSQPDTDAPRPDPASEPLAPLREWLLHWETTPAHEAGHAVAMILAGRPVRDLRVFVTMKNRSLGEVRPEPIDLTLRAAADSPAFGRHRLAREIVTAFAGPAAHLRHDPSRYFSGRRDDWRFALEVASTLGTLGKSNHFTYLRRSLVEAHRMMMDDRVWSAVTEIADSIRARNVEHTATMRGNRIRAIVQKHLPYGWDWSGIFAAPAAEERIAA